MEYCDDYDHNKHGFCLNNCLVGVDPLAGAAASAASATPAVSSRLKEPLPPPGPSQNVKAPAQQSDKVNMLTSSSRGK